MNVTLPLAMLRRISEVLDDAARHTRPLQVYAEAEKIRRIHPEANIALEDIVERLILQGRNCGLAFEIDPAQAAESVMGICRPDCGRRLGAVTHALHGTEGEQGGGTGLRGGR